jgi:hypothetical protein
LAPLSTLSADHGLKTNKTLHPGTRHLAAMV